MNLTPNFQPRYEINAVVIDIDGTLTDTSRKINLEAVKIIRDLSIPTILVSGNVIGYVKAASILIGSSEIMIGENGGVILNGWDSTPYIQADVSICKSAYQELSKKFPKLTISDSSDRLSEIAFLRNIPVEPLQQYLSTHFPQLEILDTGFAMHLKNKSVNKGTGLLKVASLMGIRHENFAAIGDAVNDIPMLNAAGLGIAVGNAHPNLKKVATLVTEKCYGDGCAEGLRWLQNYLNDK